ncbi:MAG TPA: PEP-utilizing enzyme [Myxococcaceae bacterium]|nr:PEP-utilizing enzyme [Myxococcaceae bacterium]
MLDASSSVAPPTMKFEPPGPGSWALETTHFHCPMTRFCTELFPTAFAKGFAEGTARYGMLLDHLRVVPIHGFLYAQAIVVGAPEGATGTPPRLLFQVLTRLHPTIRRRLRTSEEAFERKLWREDLRRWDEEVKPAAIRAHRVLQAVDPAALSVPELAKHLSACRAHLHEMMRVHHSFNMATGIPVGDFLVHAQEWTGKSVGELARLFKGSSPLSAPWATAEQQALLGALRESTEARELLASRAGARHILDGLLALPGEAGARMRAHLDTIGFRSLGYDLSEPFHLEVPEVLVRGIRAAVGAESLAGSGPDVQHERQVREAVPAPHRQRFEELLAEARLIYRLRDERATYSDGWATGLARRAVLAAGARLREQGKLPEAELAIDAGCDELVGLLQGNHPPLAEELSRRARWRKTATAADVPPWLGAPPGEPPPAEWLPARGRRMARATMAVMRGISETASPNPEPGASVRGLPVSPGIYEGIARIVNENGDLTRIEKGDVLVARTTSPYFNVVLPLLGAIVTDRGGQLCHAAIITREYGIPGIVGTREATKVVRDGARVRVDGTTGELKVLS